MSTLEIRLHLNHGLSTLANEATRCEVHEMFNAFQKEIGAPGHHRAYVSDIALHAVLVSMSE